MHDSHGQHSSIYVFLSLSLYLFVCWLVSVLELTRVDTYTEITYVHVHVAEKAAPARMHLSTIDFASPNPQQPVSWTEYCCVCSLLSEKDSRYEFSTQSSLVFMALQHLVHSPSSGSTMILISSTRLCPKAYNTCTSNVLAPVFSASPHIQPHEGVHVFVGSH